MCPSDDNAFNVSRTFRTRSHFTGRGWLLILSLVVAAAIAGSSLVFLGCRGSDSEPDLHVIDCGDLVVRSQFTSTLASANTIEVFCEVSATRHVDGRVSPGAEVLWIVPNGELVSQGDLLVEFDSSLLQDLRDDWQLKAFKSEGIFQQASLRYENQRSRRDTELADATEKLELILTAKGTLSEIHKLHLTELLAVIKEERQGEKVAKRNETYVEALDKLGLTDASTGTPEQARLLHQMELNDVGQAINEFEKLTRYDHPMEAEELAAAAAQARRALAQSQRNHESLMQQLAAQRDAARRTFDKEQERVAYYQKQLASCAVRAPFGGVVEHAPSEAEEEAIEPGMVLRERQKILILHDLTQLQLYATVHTPEARQVRIGMLASIQFTPGGGALKPGTVTHVRHSGTHADLVITPVEMPRLRPGTSADVEIILEHRLNVVRIPLVSLAEWDQGTYCYLLKQDGLEQRPLQLGAIGPHYAEVLNGLHVGDTIVHNAASLKTASQGGE